MSEGWLSPTTLVAGWSAVAATVASVIAWRSWRWQKGSDVPTISAGIMPSADPRLLRLVILAENRSNAGWQLETLQWNYPELRMALWKDVESQALDGAGSISIDRFNQNARTGSIALDAEVGTAGATINSISRTSIEVYFSVEDLSATSVLSVRMIMASMEARQRRKTITIKRTLTVNAPTV